MSVSLLEVIEAGGYDINTYDDAIWLLSKRQEFDELVEQAEALVDREEYHSRWDAEHREECGECHQEWLDEMSDMADDARLDKLSN